MPRSIAALLLSDARPRPRNTTAHPQWLATPAPMFYVLLGCATFWALLLRAIF